MSVFIAYLGYKNDFDSGEPFLSKESAVKYVMKHVHIGVYELYNLCKELDIPEGFLDEIKIYQENVDMKPERKEEFNETVIGLFGKFIGPVRELLELYLTETTNPELYFWPGSIKIVEKKIN